MENKILDKLNKMSANTLMQHLGIQFVSYQDEVLKATLKVDSKVHQPYGLLHGGATMALAESVGSALSVVLLHDNEQVPVGMSIQGNHLKSTRAGTITATAHVVHKGKQSHVIDITIVDDHNNVLSICRLTNAILEINRTKTAK